MTMETNCYSFSMHFKKSDLEKVRAIAEYDGDVIVSETYYGRKTGIEGAEVVSIDVKEGISFERVMDMTQNLSDEKVDFHCSCLRSEGFCSVDIASYNGLWGSCLDDGEGSDCVRIEYDEYGYPYIPEEEAKSARLYNWLHESVSRDFERLAARGGRK